MKSKHLLLTIALILLQSFVTFSAANGETLFLQSSAAQHIVSIEAEHFSLNTSGPEGHSWQNTSGSNHSGSAAMVALPEDRVFLDPGYAGTSPMLSYQVSFVTTGTHYIWVRGLGPLTSSDSLHVGMDGIEVSTGSNFNGFLPTGSLVWSGKSNGVVRTLQVATTGVHTINVWMRESGMVFDKLVLTSDAAYVPSGIGPAESLPTQSQPAVATPSISPNGGTFSSAVTVSLATTTSDAQIYYTVDGTTPSQASTLYSGPFLLTTSGTVKAAAFLTGYTPSEVAAAGFVIGSGSASWPTAGWQSATPQELGMDPVKLAEARDYALTGGGSGYIVKNGKLVFSWGSNSKRYDVKSVTKSIGGIALGLALKDGLVSINDLAQSHLPDIGNPPESNLATGWLDDITLFQLATQTAGFDKPGGYGKLLYAPGSVWAYSDGGVNWLADILTVTNGLDLNEMMFSRVFMPLGITGADLVWRLNAYRPSTINGIVRREFGAGISIDVDAMAKIGYLFLNKGRWENNQLIPINFTEMVSTTNANVASLAVKNDLQVKYKNASKHYGLMWWNNSDGSMSGVPRDAFWAWGLGDNIILVIPSLNIVASRAGSDLAASHSPNYYSALEPFFTSIVAANVAANEVSQTDVFQQGSTAQHLISIEAENFHQNTSGPEGHSWQNKSGSNYSGSTAMVALPEDRVFLDPDYAGTSPVLSYQVSFVTAGTHYLWVRGLGPSTSSDSLHVGMDGVEVSTGSNFNGFSPTGSLVWSGKSNGVVRTLQVASAGVHTINVWMRESGMIFDKLVLTSDAAYVPSGTGPAESLPTQSQPSAAIPSISPNGGTFGNAVTVSLATTTSGAQIYYTVDGTAPSQASTLYSGPFLLSTSGTVNAAAFLTGYTTSGVATAEFVIGNGNPKPTLNSIGNKVVAEKQPLSFIVTAGDSDLSIPVLSANLNDLPAGAVFVDNGDGTGSFSWTPQTGDAAGSPYMATFKATDAVDPLLSVQETISITVTQTAVFQQGSTGQHLVSIEAERFHLNTSGPEGHSWQNTSGSNYSGSSAMVALPEDRVFLDPDYAGTSPVLSYQVSFVTTGTHYLWVRGLGPSTSSDSLHVGMDGVEVSTGSNFNGFLPTGSLVWSGKSNGVVRTLQVTTAGVHTINVWMRESGMVFDKLMLTSDAAYVPSGTGPTENPPTQSLPAVLDESFSSNTLANYSIIPTNTQGGSGQVLYDPDGQSLQFITGSNVGIELARNVGTLGSGQFSLEFWPSVSYSPGGTFSFRLKQDANNYYEVKNSDVGGTGILRKVVAGVVVDAAVIQDEYIQDKNYHLLINFSPQSTKVLAFGKFYTLDTNSAEIAVKTLEIEFAGQDGYIDNIRYAAGLNDYYVAMGDSITLASSHDDISADGIGYQPILATWLAEDKDYPHTVVNKGVSGEDSAAGLLRLPNLLQAYPQSRFLLIQYGTNDVLYGVVPSGLGLEPGDTGYPGSFKDNMQKIIDQIKAADKIPMLAKVPKAFGTRDYMNPTLQVFNAVIDELVNENYIGVTPPNFYCHFGNNPDEMDDTLHPNGTGFISMANIWYQVLTDSYGGCSP